MSITIKKRQQLGKRLQAKIDKLSHEQEKLEKELDFLYYWKYHKSLCCKKCGKAFEPNEVGYKTYKARRSIMHCQYGGEYDIYQTLEYQYLACCPECGHNFGIPVKTSDTIENTRVYSRWQDKPDFKEEGRKCISNKINKLDNHDITYLSQQLKGY